MREFLNRLTSFFKKADHDCELDAEVESHIAFAIDEYNRAGMDPEEARRQALIRFGGREAAVFGASWPVSRRRCLMRRTHDSETLKRTAMTRVPSFASHAASTSPRSFAG